VPPLDSTERDAWIGGEIERIETKIDSIEAAAVGDKADAADARFTTDRRDGLFILCAGLPRTAANPLGLRGEQHVSLLKAREFYRANYDRAEQRGVSRIVWHMPAGYSGTHEDPEDHRGAAAVLGAMQQRTVPIYEHVDFYEPAGPHVQSLGLPRMPIIHNAHVRVDGRTESDWHDVSPEKTREAIDRLKLPPDYAGPLVIDYEPYVQGWDPQRTVSAYLTVLHAARQRLPQAKIAFFGLPHVRYAKPGGGGEPLTREMIEPILSQVDFLAPQHYSGRIDWTPGMEAREREKMRVSRTYGKLVLPFVNPRAAQPRKGQWLEPEAFRNRVALLVQEGADGIIVWDFEDPTVAHEQDRRQAEAMRLAVDAAGASRAEVWKQEVRRFLTRNPRATVGVAISPFVPLSTESTDISEYRGWEIFDFENPAHYRMMVNEIIQPLVLAGVTELWFDRGPAESFGPDILELCAHLRQRFNLHCMLYPHAIDSLGEEDRDALRIVGFATEAPAPDQPLPALTLQDEEIGLILRGSPGPPGEAIEAWRERGFVLWSADERFDQHLRAEQPR